jgi:hypothetical protein
VSDPGETCIVREPIDIDVSGGDRLLIADVDGDQDLDVLAAGDGAFQVLRNDGLGGLTAEAVRSEGGVEMVVADWDGDGDPDLAVDCSSSGSDFQVCLLRNDGSGAFSTAASLSLDGEPLGLAAGNFDGDTKADLAVITDPIVDLDNRHLVLFTSDGSLPVQEKSPVLVPGIDFLVGGTLAADLDGDGKLDVVNVNGQSDQLELIFGRGDGTFDASVPVTTGADSEPTRAVAVDMNDDAKLDLATVASGQDNVTLFVNDGDRSMRLDSALDTRDRPVEAASGDLNFDDLADLVVANKDDDTVSFYLSPQGGSGSVVHVEVGEDPVAVAVGDLDDDGAPDVVVGNRTSHTVSVVFTIP